MDLRDRLRALPELGGGFEIIAAIIESAMVSLNVMQPGLQARAMPLLVHAASLRRLSVRSAKPKDPRESPWLGQAHPGERANIPF